MANQLDDHEAAAPDAVRPGTVTGKILAQWWNRPEPERKGA